MSSLSLSGPRKIRTQNKQTIIRRKKRVRILSLSLSLVLCPCPCSFAQSALFWRRRRWFFLSRLSNLSFFLLLLSRLCDVLRKRGEKHVQNLLEIKKRKSFVKSKSLLSWKATKGFFLLFSFFLRTQKRGIWRRFSVVFFWRCVFFWEEETNYPKKNEKTPRTHRKETRQRYY